MSKMLDLFEKYLVKRGYSRCSNIKCIPDTTNVQVEIKKGD